MSKMNKTINNKIKIKIKNKNSKKITIKVLVEHFYSNCLIEMMEDKDFLISCMDKTINRSQTHIKVDTITDLMDIMDVMDINIRVEILFGEIYFSIKLPFRKNYAF